MPSKRESKGPMKAFRSFFSKNKKVFSRGFIVLFAAGLLAGTIAFAVLLGENPSDPLNQTSFIGFFEFLLVCALGVLGYLAFYTRRPAQVVPPSAIETVLKGESIPLKA